MTIKAHPDVYDNGLSTLVGTNLNYVICQTEPTALSDCTTLSGSGGKRISNVESLTSGQITLENGTNPVVRQIRVPQYTATSTIQVGVTAGVADLWLAIYDGSRVLLTTDALINEEKVVSSTEIIPEWTFGMGDA